MDGEKRIYTLLATAAACVGLLLCSHICRAERADHDRLRVIERFLSAVYPELQQHGGFLTLQTDEFNSGPGGEIYLSFVQCWPGRAFLHKGQNLYFLTATAT
jgi:hypothetical protein